MNATTLIRKLRADGIALCLNGDRLVVTGQKCRLTPERAKLIQDAKPSIIRALTSEIGPTVVQEPVTTKPSSLETGTTRKTKKQAKPKGTSVGPEVLSKTMNQALDLLVDDPLFTPDLIHNLRCAVVETARNYDHLSYDDLRRMWLVKAASLQADAGLSEQESMDQAYSWLKAEVGLERLLSLCPATKTATGAPTNEIQD